MDDYCSPQWVDFTSPQDVPSDDYFEKNHGIYECKGGVEVSKIKMASEDNVNIEEISETGPNNEKLEMELNIIKNTPIKVIYSPSLLRSSKKCKLTQKMTYDDILHEAIETLEHCVTEKIDTFKKPVLIKNNVSKFLKFHALDNQVNVLPNIKVKQLEQDEKPNQEIESLVSTNSCDYDTSSNNLLKSNEFNLKSGIDNPIDNTPVNCIKSLRVSIPSKQEHCISLQKSRRSKQSKPLTYQCRRQSLVFRRRSNQFNSLATTVHKFENETPKRSHTKCNKDLEVKTAPIKRHTSVTRRSMVPKLNVKRRSVPSFSQREKKDSKPGEMKELAYDRTSPNHAKKTSNTTKLSTSPLSLSTKRTARNKHVVSKIVNINSSEIVLKKEKILFFDIPIQAKKATTRPIPFSFEYRDKAGQQAKSKQLQLKDNKSINNVKSQNIQTKISQKNIGTGSINNVASASHNLKAAMKINKSRSTSSLKLYEKTEDTSKKNEHSHSKDTEQLKKKSTSMSFKNSLGKSKDIKNDKNTEDNVQTKDINHVKKQSSLALCKEKSKSESKKIVITQSKENSNKMKRECSTSNVINTNTDVQENKCPNVNPSIGMNSYERGKQRHEFDEKVRQRIKMEEEMHQKMEADKLKQEKLQIAMLRKQLEVKARPMPVYKPLIPIRSTKPLTEPQSPAWAYKKKIRKET